MALYERIESERKEFTYFNPKYHTVPHKFFTDNFSGMDSNSAIRQVLADINKWIKYYEPAEVEELLCNVVDYKDCYDRKTGYLNLFRAIRFLICIQSGMTKFDSYLDIMHDRKEIKEWTEGINTTDRRKRSILALVASYTNKSLVLKVAQVMNAPIELQYQGYKHQMIEVLRDIAVNGNTARARVDAANSLLNHLNPNEFTNIQLNFGKGKSFIEQAQDALKLLATKKLKDIKKGKDVSEVINVDIIEEAAKLGVKTEEDELREAVLESNESSQGGDDS